MDPENLTKLKKQKIMLIIRRIVEHLQDRQKATVIPPFNSPAVFGCSRPITVPPVRVRVPRAAAHKI